MYVTDKRADVWSRDFIIWKIKSGLWAVVWAGIWNKRVWADYEQLLMPVFSIFRSQRKIYLPSCLSTSAMPYHITLNRTQSF